MTPAGEHIACQLCKARSASIFNDLKPAELQALDAIKQCQFFKKGEFLFHEGAYPRGLYCVQSGKLKVTQTGMDGREQIVHLVNDGDMMGYRALLGDDLFSCSAVAMEDSHVCFVPKASFYTMVENNSKLALKIAQLLSADLREAERKITHTAQRPVKDRLAEALLDLKRNYGYAEDALTINVSITREDLANLAGTTRETATRLLYDFQEQQLIRLNGKKISLLDEPQLIRIANSTH